jgi:hypothetical protein
MTRLRLLAIAGALLAGLYGCNVPDDPDKTVIVEIIGIREDDDRKRVRETLKKMSDGSWHRMTSTASGNNMTVRLTPVGDVDRFSKRIAFGKVTDVQGRVVKVDFLLPPGK